MSKEEDKQKLADAVVEALQGLREAGYSDQDIKDWLEHCRRRRLVRKHEASATKDPATGKELEGQAFVEQLLRHTYGDDKPKQ